MDHNQLLLIEEELKYCRKKIAVLEEILNESHQQKVKMAEIISKLIDKIK